MDVNKRGEGGEGGKSGKGGKTGEELRGRTCRETSAIEATPSRPLSHWLRRDGARSIRAAACV